ncbi:MAG: alanine--tRNA ligase [Pseudomonadota bacterium]|nr:alanine--tRNA ligase [Pseudomonadota bacterium]
MLKLTTAEISERFLNFFQQRQHQLIKGVRLTPDNDPTLLFINSGMAPLKDYFLGLVAPPSPRLCNLQPCLRTTDIDAVGDRHHLTYFSMLGSWSIGDYYKEKAVEYAYDLLVNGFGFDPDRLYATVFAGDNELALPADDVSAQAWQRVGIPAARVIYLGKEDNFWGPAGTVGPCGPCTEVFYDCGADYGAAYAGKEFDTTSRYIEVWNAGVFIELEKKNNGKYEPLRLQSVDTGSGLERMAMIMQQVDDVYHTDQLLPVFQEVSKTFTNTEQARIIVDHLRAATAIMAEGITPANSGRAYVLRRMLRKCVALSLSCSDDSQMLEDYMALIISSNPEWQQSQDFIQQHCREEFAEFKPTLQTGLRMLTKKMQAQQASKRLAAATIFELVATHGLPLLLISSYLEREGFSFDLAAYKQEFTTHRELSRTGVKNKQTDQVLGLLGDLPATEFVGYQQLQCQSPLTKILRKQRDTQGCEYEQCTEVTAATEIIFLTASTPFYAEAGGQVADRGVATMVGAAATTATELVECQITDVQKKNNHILHFAKLTKGKLTVGAQLDLRVDKEHRLLVRRNHSLTHLVQAALRQVVGKHIVQKGSYVDAQKFRFDFQQPQALTSEQLATVEQLVNRWIWANLPRVSATMAYREAVAQGALFMLGENYQEQVRVISFGAGKEAVSVELCGGTHVESCGEIGMLRFSSETSIAKGVRRIEGVSGEAALLAFQQDSDLLRQASRALNVNRHELLERIKQLKTKPAPVANTMMMSETTFATTSKQLSVCIGQAADTKALRQLCNNSKHDITAVLSVADDSFAIAIAVATESIAANEILQSFFAQVAGRGGGKRNYAQGGGKTAGQTFASLAAVFKQTLLAMPV